MNTITDPNYVDPAIALPIAAVLWAALAVILLVEHARGGVR